MTERGRLDLARYQIRQAEHRRHMMWIQEKDWKGSVKRFDRRFLSGALYKSYRTIRRHLRSLALQSHLCLGIAIGLGLSVDLLGEVR
jgi:hypothetical protein